MSLKAFHFVFIGVAIVLTAAFTVWCIRAYLVGDALSMLVLALGSILACAGLMGYAVRVRRKLKDVGWI